MSIDKTTIVLLHGFMSSSRYWSKLRPLLATTGHTIITIDLLGFATAPKPNDSAYTYDDHVAYVAERIRAHNITGNIILIGHSMGALIAARYATTHRDQVHSLIALNPPLYKNTLEARQTLRETNAFYRYMLDSKYRGIGWSIMKLFAKHSKLSREGSLRNVIERAEAFTDLAAIRVRTMVLVGLRDRPIYSQNMSQLQGNSLLTLVTAEVSHHSPLQSPVVVHQLIKKYL